MNPNEQLEYEATEALRASLQRPLLPDEVKTLCFASGIRWEWVQYASKWETEYEAEERRLMGRYTAETGGDFTPAPPGSHVARCIKIIDIGTHHDEYQGEPQIRNQIVVQWELPNETLEVDGVQKPFIVSKFYTNSLSEKANLRKDLEAWRGRAFGVDELLKFDLMNILGKPCMLGVVHTEKRKAKVASIMALPSGLDCPPAVNKPEAFWLDEFDQKKFDALSDGYKKLVMDSDEWKQRTGQKPGASTAIGTAMKTAAKAKIPDDLDDDIPF